MDDPPKKCVIDCAAAQPPAGDCIHICSYPTLPPLPPIILNPPPKHHHSSLSLPLKVSLLILLLTFSFFLLYTLYKFYTVWYRSRRRRRPPPSPAQETHDEFLDHDAVDHPIWYIRTIGLQPSVISAITVVKYSKADGLIEGTDCSVCLSDFQEDETLRLLPKCNHAFHISCIDTWLRSHTNCPLCRAAIVKNSTRDQNLEETQVAISIPEEVGREERPREEGYQSSELRTEEEDVNKGDVVGGSGGGDFLIMRRSVSLNDNAACRVRSDVLCNSNNNYHSDRHQLQLQSMAGFSSDQS